MTTDLRFISPISKFIPKLAKFYRDNLWLNLHSEGRATFPWDQESYFIDIMTSYDNLFQLIGIDEEDNIKCAILGYHFEDEVNTAIIEVIAIDSEYRNKGLGTFMINEIKEWATSRRASTLSVSSFENYNAVPFYTKIGFGKVATTTSMGVNTCHLNMGL